MPDGVQAVRCYSDGVEIEHTAKPEAVSAWMANCSHAWDSRQQLIRLRMGQATYSVDFVRAAFAEQPAERELPSYPCGAMSPTSEPRRQQRTTQSGAGLGMPQPWRHGPRVVSFHSFKGALAAPRRS